MNIFKKINSKERKQWKKDPYKQNYKYENYVCKNSNDLDCTGFTYEIVPQIPQPSKK